MEMIFGMKANEENCFRENDFIVTYKILNMGKSF